MPWLGEFFSRRRRYTDISISIQEHLEEKIDELVDAGMSRGEATRAARREFGNVAALQERSREVWQWPTMESIWADTRFALRQLRKSPGFTATAVLTLALGIGVNATMFSLVSAFLMPRLPGRDPQGVVAVSSVNPNQSYQPDVYAVSALNYLAWRADTRVFADMAADAGRTGSLAGQGQPEAIRYATVSPNYFGIFGVSPMVGRTFVEGDDTPGRNHVMILSYGLWKSHYSGDPAVVGRTLRLNREDYTVVGVMREDFRLLGYTPQLWVPLTLSAADTSPLSRKDRYLFLFARLAPGVTLQQVRAEMNTLAHQSQHDFPDTEKRWGASVRTLPDYLVYEFDIRNSLYVIMAMVAFVLLIACVNVAGLLLTRGAGRQKELAIRVSLGASRSRVVRQLLTEGVVIALAGGAVGLFLAVLGIRILRAALTFNVAISSVPVSLDRRVLIYALCISLASALLSSLAPALKASHTQIDTDLKSESRTSSGGRAHSRLRAVLVGGEIAIALFLLMASSLIAYGIYRLDHQSLGFRQDHLLTASIVLDHARYSSASQQLQFVRDLIPSLEQIPGVENAAVTSDLPASGGNKVSIRVQGEPSSPNDELRNVLNVETTPTYFRVVGVPLQRGRTFTDADDDKASRVVVVNEEFVQRYFQGHDVLGKQIQLDGQNATPIWSEVVGVVSNVKYSSEAARVDPEVYQPLFQKPVASFSIMLRTSVDPNSLIPELRHAVSELDPDLPLLRAMSMDGVIEVQHNGDPVFSRMLGIFAILALVLASIGIYGLIAFSVLQRTHEIGIRLALGAKRSDISWMILREGLRIAVIGSSIGMVIAIPLPRLFNSMFTGFHFDAFNIFPTVLTATLLVAAFATWVPARRAARVDATAALRNE
ncbi:MAG TPA: ABC transporter permease [Silvibacterium sp.]|nr:ABC transporter permease [Silvibacterium sp.]